LWPCHPLPWPRRSLPIPRPPPPPEDSVPLLRRPKFPTLSPLLASNKMSANSTETPLAVPVVCLMQREVVRINVAPRTPPTLDTKKRRQTVDREPVPCCGAGFWCGRFCLGEIDSYFCHRNKPLVYGQSYHLVSLEVVTLPFRRHGGVALRRTRSRQNLCLSHASSGAPRSASSIWLQRRPRTSLERSGTP
jgi:hypothetical protein